MFMESARTSAQRPKQIGILALVGNSKLSIRGHNFEFELDTKKKGSFSISKKEFVSG